MGSLKRKSDAEADEQQPAKLAKLSTTELQLLDKPELIKRYLTLQAQLDDLATRPVTASVELSEEKIVKKTSQARKLLVKGIKGQMTTYRKQWKASCKTSRAKFSYTGVVASSAVFYQLFKVSQESQKKKKLQFKPAEFAQVVDEHIQTSVRYAYLNIAGENVNVAWKPEDLQYTVSGFYGKG